MFKGSIDFLAIKVVALGKRLENAAVGIFVFFVFRHSRKRVSREVLLRELATRLRWNPGPSVDTSLEDGEISMMYCMSTCVIYTLQHFSRVLWPTREEWGGILNSVLGRPWCNLSDFLRRWHSVASLFLSYFGQGSVLHNRVLRNLFFHKSNNSNFTLWLFHEYRFWNWWKNRFLIVSILKFEWISCRNAN